ncbi:MAG: hypothetical protein GC181_11405 [Bacteroidetes bacterium]|nr:hypothetical protein [Bacteroidota bacterium]
MKEEPLYRSKLPWIGYAILSVAGLGFICLSAYLGQNSLQDEYYDGAMMFMAIFFCIAGLAMLIGLSFLRRIVVFSDRIEEQNQKGDVKKVTMRSEFTSWVLLSQLPIPKERIRFEELILFKGKKKYRLAALYINEFENIVSVLTEKLPNNKDYIENYSSRFKKGNNLGILILGIMVLSMGMISGFRKTDDTQPSDLVMVKGTLKDSMEVDYIKRNTSLLLHLHEYPDFVFRLSGAQKLPMHPEKIAAKFENGDSVFVRIRKDDFLKKISREKKLSFSDKHFNYKFIDIYGLRNSNSEYIRYDDLNIVITSKENTYLGVAFIIVGFVLVVFGGVRMLM